MQFENIYKNHSLNFITKKVLAEIYIKSPSIIKKVKLNKVFRALTAKGKPLPRSLIIVAHIGVLIKTIS